MKSGMTRWKTVPSYSLAPFFEGEFQSLVPSARPMKLATVCGASFSKRLQTKVPSEVLKTAYVPGVRVDMSNSLLAVVRIQEPRAAILSAVLMELRQAAPWDP